MGKYQYSLVRCVPEPRTGEFINIGAIAGSSEEGDWATREIENLKRAAKLCGGAELSAVLEFIANAARQISEAEDTFFPMPDNWLEEMASERRNVVQLSEPRLAVGQSAEEVLDLVCARQLIDPATSRQAFVSKSKLLARIRSQLKTRMESAQVLERPILTVGDSHITAQLDYAFGTNQAVQLTQAWSFQKETVEDVATDVKAWGYALERLRNGGISRLHGGDRLLIISGEVPIGVIVAPPTTHRQHEVFEEAREVFEALKVSTYGEDQAPALADDIAGLLAAV
jgi:hypothetical protein